MELEFKTKNEVMNFFQSYQGYTTVKRISELLVSHSNVQEQEIKHIQQHLHQLKKDGFLLIKNEGDNIYNERFSSTLERISKYFTPPTPKTPGKIFKLQPEYRGMGIDLRNLYLYFARSQLCEKIKDFFKKP